MPLDAGVSATEEPETTSEPRQPRPQTLSSSRTRNILYSTNDTEIQLIQSFDTQKTPLDAGANATKDPETASKPMAGKNTRSSGCANKK
mmetsp:Transcript_1961/g.3962  ORF Transcript_1961/g.3962 Transcript_1961/m.3962 type:complete len:89 (+) Transcript_1961:263-529(+)